MNKINFLGKVFAVAVVASLVIGFFAESKAAPVPANQAVMEKNILSTAREKLHSDAKCNYANGRKDRVLCSSDALKDSKYCNTENCED